MHPPLNPRRKRLPKPRQEDTEPQNEDIQERDNDSKASQKHERKDIHVCKATCLAHPQRLAEQFVACRRRFVAVVVAFWVEDGGPDDGGAEQGLVACPDESFPGGDFADPLVWGEAGGYSDHDGFAGAQVSELGAAICVCDAGYGLEEGEDGGLEWCSGGIGGGGWDVG